MRQLQAFLLTALLVACTNAGQPGANTTDPFTVVEGPFRVHLATEPAGPRVGQQVTFTITVEDAASGTPAENIEVRPIADVTMPDRMGMMTRLSPPKQVGPGRFQTDAVFEHEGTLRFSVSIARESVVTPVTFPEIQIQP